MASSSTESPLPMSTLFHLLTHRLSSTNYLLWKSQINSILDYQNLIPLIDGSSIAPAPEITVDGKKVSNPDYKTWVIADQKARMFLLASLSEEASAEIVGLSTARQIWLTLEATYSNSSIERIQNLRDKLRLLQKGNTPVSEFGRKFKHLCDQLTAIGSPVEETDKTHWFICGLGPSFENFSTSIRTSRDQFLFRDLTAKAEAHELFLQSIHGTVTPAVAFSANRAPSGSRGRGGRGPRGSHGRGRRSPHCQLCRINGHYADSCPKLGSYASRSIRSDSDLAKAFQAQCHVSSNTPDWFVDSGATDHMSSSTSSVSHSVPYTGSSKVVFGNGKSLPITHIGNSSVTPTIGLRDVLVVPNLTKNLLSISKLTRDNHLDVLFSENCFHIQDRTTKKVLARGRCDRGLYILAPSSYAFAVTKRSGSPASFELWHSRLGHVNFTTLCLLNKLGILSVTSILPKPIICKFCQMAKSHRLPFLDNEKRASGLLDIIHCDLWGPSPIYSVDGVIVDPF